MNDPDDELLQRRLIQCNWGLLVVLVLASLPFADVSLTLGIAGGGLIAIGAHHWRGRSLRKLLAAQPEPSTGLPVDYFLRLIFIGFSLYLLIGVIKAHPIGVAIGVSVVVFNLVLITAARLWRSRRE